MWALSKCCFLSIIYSFTGTIHDACSVRGPSGLLES